MRHGGQVLVEQLAAQGVRRVFSVPGESFLAALDGLHDSGIENVVCRQEGGAAMMAEATGKMTGRPGVAFVTRGPGATNASAGVHVARQDSTPMVLFVGQIARGHRDREAFQEVDYRAMFGPLAKWVAEIDQTDRIPEYVNRAFHVAMSGRPGPVVLALPEDMLSDQTGAPFLEPTAPAVPAVGDAQVDAILDFLKGAERPLVVAGGPGWSAQAAADLQRFGEAQGLPITAAFRRQDYIDNRSPAYAGDLGVGSNPKLVARAKEADAVLVLGSRIGDCVTQGYEMWDPAAPGRRFAHVHPEPETMGGVYRCDLAVTARAPDVLARLAQAPKAGDWADWQRSARADYEAWLQPKETPGAVKLENAIRWLSENLPGDTVVTNGAGNYAAFLHRYYQFREFGTQVAPTSGSMGYGFPSAVAASLQYPERVSLCLAGDGCFQMTLNEMSTAMQYGATPLVIVANNGRYGTIRMHQERSYPGRVSGTDCHSPDFAALARAYGGFGAVVETDADFPAAVAEARASGTLAVIELRLDTEMLTTGQTVSEVRQAASS
ncbi:thiamine pyrophosphate-binding protein [Psychromarinibacter sp. C21-152]|uniref:Thiamine pyrophosphate-binding protein n=1 Tax=Psychromarinibacter sediminicola TaxID=3033385 RepID=A0AAE3NWH9_9RHOB|nr:thiamine pyrophosphate-binding protein [Psychromarinibacter sediminicola]MDF0602969.1 thiamine pyrophosphate-binding protein [Psychromarinibacter sediminicola]